MAVFEGEKYFQIHGIRTSYLKKIFTYGIEPVFLSPFTPIELVEKLYKECSGILLMGGGDIDPSYYNEGLDNETKVDDKNRDEIELFLAKKTVLDKKPFLGICRGLQVLNVSQGGTLTQHLPKKFPNEKHGISEGGSYSNLKSAECAHDVKINQNSKLYDILKRDQITVACGHHQCINKVGEGLIVGALSPSGVIESIENTDKEYFCLGVQFHPEVYEGRNLESIFEKFFEAVKNN